MAHQQQRLVDQTREDLRWMVREFAEFTGDEHDLRRASVPIRRLLADSLLQQARRAAGAGGVAHFEVFPLEQAVDVQGVGNEVTMALALGMRIRRRAHGPLVISESGAKDRYRQAPQMVRRSLPLEAYLKSTCAVFRGRALSRRALIKYVANRDGGVHFGGRRKLPAGEELALEAMGATPIRIDDFPPLYVELLACIQAMISSPTVMEPFGLTPARSPLFDAASGGGRDRHQWAARSQLQLHLGSNPGR